jgi:ABC-type transport system involved in cytochrome c biogenesis permease component
MTALPIVERELRVASRRRATYAMRWGFTLVAVLVFLMGLGMLMRRGMPAAEHGRFLFRLLLALGFVYCLLVGARTTADSVSEEKREGTLGLLFLTDLRGYDVVLGKLAAGSLNAVYGLLAILPVIFLPLQLGGVTGVQLLLASVLLLNTLFLSVMVGVWISALSREERPAVFATLLAILVLTVGPGLIAFLVASHGAGPWDRPEPIVALLALSPGFGLWHVLIDGQTPGGWGMPRWVFWLSQAWVHLTGWILFAWTCRMMPHLWRIDYPSPRLARWSAWWNGFLYGLGPARVAIRRRLLEQHPLVWLTQRERGKPMYAWGFLGAVTAIWVWGRWTEGDVMTDRQVASPMVWLVLLFFRVWLVSEASARLSEDRRSGALELLLSTPLNEREVVRGQWLALRRQFLMPWLVFLVLEFLLLRQSHSEGWLLAQMPVRLVEFTALGWVGMWLGLTLRSVTRAILVTFGLVLVLPWAVSSLAVEVVRGMGPGLEWMGVAMPAMEASIRLGVSLVSHLLWGWVWARGGLRHRFRRVAVRSHEGLVGEGWRSWGTGVRGADGLAVGKAV